MTKTYRKKTKDILIVTHIINETHITEESRTKIQIELDHAESDKIEHQKKIDKLKTKIAILDGA